MDTRTGEIVNMDFVNKLKLNPETASQAKWYKEIPSVFVPELQGMNRKQRRTWYSQNKHLFKKVEENYLDISIETAEEHFKRGLNEI